MHAYEMIHSIFSYPQSSESISAGLGKFPDVFEVK